MTTLLLALLPSASFGFQFEQWQIDELWRRLPKTQEDKIYYHWTRYSTGLLWITDGYVNEDDLRRYNSPEVDRSKGNSLGSKGEGGGLYISADNYSSKSFGNICVADKIKAGTPIYDREIVSSVLGRNMTRDGGQEASELGQIIPFIRPMASNSAWFIVNSPQNTSELTYGGLYSDIAKVNISIYLKPSEITEALHLLVQRNDQDAIYLENFLQGTLAMVATHDSTMWPPSKYQWALGPLQRDLLNEFLIAKTQHRTPDYVKTGAIDRFYKAAFPFPMKLDLLDPMTQELIQNRQWDQVVARGKILAQSAAQDATIEKCIGDRLSKFP